MTELTRLTASEAAARIRKKELISTELVTALLDRVAVRDHVVHAWTWLKPEAVLEAARTADASPAVGPLHGVPVGIKDIIYTADMPTQMNSALYEDFFPRLDAPCISVLRSAGAIVMGKLDTVEFAVDGRRARTTNPHDPERTPGGSSSGSAAAVADFQVPLSLGTQTGGSVIRPASFCGTFAIKPTWNTVSHEGFKICAASMDTLGWYGRSVEDLMLLADVYRLRPDGRTAPTSLKGAKIGICRSPVWEQALPETHKALKDACAMLEAEGAELSDAELPGDCAGLTEAHRIIMQAEMRVSFLADSIRFPDLYPAMQETVRTAAGYSTADLAAAHDLAARCRGIIDRLFGGFDAVLTPSAPGYAPIGPQDTGKAVFNRIWTLTHMPSVNLPLYADPLPVGLTLTGPRYSDRRILDMAKLIAQAAGI